MSGSTICFSPSRVSGFEPWVDVAVVGGGGGGGRGLEGGGGVHGRFVNRSPSPWPGTGQTQRQTDRLSQQEGELHDALDEHAVLKEFPPLYSL